MMKYERITGQEWSENIDLKQELGYSYIYKRLHELEDDLESGKLVRLPCTVGDKVYHISNKKAFEEVVVKTSYSITNNQIDLCNSCIYTNGDKYDSFYRLSKLGKSLFLTREQAEAKLKGQHNEELF